MTRRGSFRSFPVAASRHPEPPIGRRCFLRPVFASYALIAVKCGGKALARQAGASKIRSRGGIVNHRLLEIISVPAPERIIRLKTVLDRTGLSRSTIYRKMAEGTFPPQLKIGVHGAGWHESAIDRWVANPAAYRPDNDNDPGYGDARG